MIAEDLALLREGLVALLRENGIEVVAQVQDGAGLLRAIAGHQPDLAIVDVRLPPTFSDEGLLAAIEARRRQPALGVLVLSQHVETAYASELIGDDTAGIGYLLKERVGDVRAFLDALHTVAAGGTVLDRQVVARHHQVEVESDRVEHLSFCGWALNLSAGPLLKRSTRLLLPPAPVCSMAHNFMSNWCALA